MLFDFFKTECKHKKVPIDAEEAYCPDCGAYIRNKWYLVRCACCNIKRPAHIHYDEIVPDNKFCKNCGEHEYYIQEIEKPNFTDIHYAVFKRTVINQENISTKQVWVEEEYPQNNKTNEIKTIPVFSKQP